MSDGILDKSGDIKSDQTDSTTLIIDDPLIAAAIRCAANFQVERGNHHTLVTIDPAKNGDTEAEILSCFKISMNGWYSVYRQKSGHSEPLNLE